MTAIPESSKYRSQYGTTPVVTDYPSVMASGNSFTISPLWSTSGLVGYWPFEEGSGSSTADASGNGNTAAWNGTPAGNNSTYYTAGKVGNYAGAFNGATDYVVAMSNGTPLDISGNGISFGAWVYPKISNVYQEIVGNVSSTGNANRNYGLYLSALGTSDIFVALGGTNLPSAGNNFAISSPWITNAWNQVFVTYNGATMTIYLDGTSVYAQSVTGSLTYSAGASSLFIGNQGTSYSINDLIDDVRVYNRALSSAEIAAIYNAEK